MAMNYSTAPLDAAIASRKVDTIAQLRALTGSALSGTVKMLGYWAAGDGGGGDWYWASTSSATDNSGLVVKPNSISSGAGRWIRIYDRYVNVKWFGAKGDSRKPTSVAGFPGDGTDDTAAFQAAVDATSAKEVSVWVPNVGATLCYRLTDTITLSQANRIEGESVQAGQGPELAMYLNGDQNGFQSNIPTINDYPSRIMMKGLRIRHCAPVADAAARTNTGIRLERVANGYWLEHIMVVGFQDGIYVGASTGGKVGDRGRMDDVWCIQYIRYGIFTERMDNDHVWTNLAADSNNNQAGLPASTSFIYVGDSPQESFLNVRGIKHEATDDGDTVRLGGNNPGITRFESVTRRLGPAGGVGDVIRFMAVPSYNVTLVDIGCMVGRGANLLNIPSQGFALPVGIGSETIVRKLPYYHNGKGHVIVRGDQSRTATQYEPEYQVYSTPLTGNRTVTLPGGPNGLYNGRRFVVTKTTSSGSGKLTVFHGASVYLGEIPANATGKISAVFDGATWQLEDWEIHGSETRYAAIGHSHVIQDFVSQYVPQRVYVVGMYYNAVTSFATGTATNTSLAANLLWAEPFILTEQHSFDQIGIAVGTAAASTSARLGIYAADASGLPGALVLDAGEVTVDTTGARLAAITRLLDPGFYWLAIVASGAVTVAHAPLTVAPAGMNAITTSGIKEGYANRSFTYAALPDPWGTPAAWANTGPMVSLRLAS